MPKGDVICEHTLWSERDLESGTPLSATLLLQNLNKFYHLFGFYIFLLLNEINQNDFPFNLIGLK